MLRRTGFAQVNLKNLIKRTLIGVHAMLQERGPETRWPPSHGALLCLLWFVWCLPSDGCNSRGCRNVYMINAWHWQYDFRISRQRSDDVQISRHGIIGPKKRTAILILAPVLAAIFKGFGSNKTRPS